MTRLKIEEKLDNINETLRLMVPEANLLTTLKNHFNMSRDGKIYGVKFPKFGDVKTATGIKYLANEGLVIEPSTKTVQGTNDYENITLFQHYDCNAHLTEDGELVVDAIRGQEGFETTGAVDVCTITCERYYHYWEDDTYEYYEMSDTWHQGFHLAHECLDRNGKERGYAIYAKCVAGDINGVPYSSFGLVPACAHGGTGAVSQNVCYSGNITYFHKKGTYYMSGTMAEVMYINWMFMMKYATKNIQSIYGGCTNYQSQYKVSAAEENVSRVIVTNSQASYLVIGSCISIGDVGTNTNYDRYYWYMHNLAYNVTILEIEDLGDGTSAVYVDSEPFTTTTTTYVTCMHWRSGFSEDILGDDGIPIDGAATNSQKYPCVINGIELFVGGYEVIGNTIFDINSDNTYSIYQIDDASQLSSDVSTIKANYDLSDAKFSSYATNSWAYVTDIDYDFDTGTYGEHAISGGNSSNCYSDGIYLSTATSGQRELLVRGGLSNGDNAGLFCVHGSSSVASALWFIVARPSLNG